MIEGCARRITVVGDLLLDRDIVGRVDRLCPDAPAPVLDVSVEHARPGGAGLAAALLAADGHDVTLVSAVGDDVAGALAVRLLGSYGVRVVRLATDGVTREKVRVRAGHQSLVRVDRGTACAPRGRLPAEALEAIDAADAVLVSDYAGGVTSDAELRELLAEAAHRRPVVWDPHPRGSAPVPGCRMVTPNAGEATALATSPVEDGSPLTDASARAGALLAAWAARSVCVTLGAKGALLTYGAGSPLVVPAPNVEGGDTCGAGDRFAAAATAALAGGATESESVQEAVLAASAFVASGGAAGFSAAAGGGADAAGAPSPEQVAASGWERVAEVRARGGTVVATGGCFDLLHAGHVALLRAARGLGDCLVVCLNSDDSVRRLKGAARPLVPEADRARVLEALECVDAVQVFGEDTPEQALRSLRPDVWAKGGDYALADLPEATVLAEWGGQSVVLPYLDGRSTTALIGAARGRVAWTEEQAT